MVDILTLRLDPTSQAHFNDLRRQYFPPERNHIPAHLTLFHALPAEPWILTELETVARQQSPFPLSVTGLRSLGKGVAYKLASAPLLALHTDLSTRFAAELIPQDRQRLQPHVVIQNKTTPEAARLLLAKLSADFTPWEVMAEGLDLWHYLGGPWQHVRTVPFPSGE